MSAPKLTVNLRQAVAAAILVLAGVLLVLVDYPDRGFSFKPAVVADESDAVRATYALVEASRAVSLLGDHYAFQSRLQPRRMLMAALQGIEDRFDRFLVSPSVDLEQRPGSAPPELPDQVEIRYRDKVGSFTLADVGDLYQMAWKLMEVFEFFQPRGEDVEGMEEAAIEGMLTVLDPHTTYMSEEEYRDMKLSTRGSFGGLGIVISVREGKLRIISVMAGTPAAREGLRKDDHIVQIDQESTVNMLVNEAAERLRGKPGTGVQLWIQRDDAGEPFAVDVTREIIKVNSVLAKDLDGRTAYVRVKSFQTNTAAEVRRFLEQTYESAPPAAVILDLRGNSGGVMAAAVELADLFLPEGTVVRTVARVREGTKSEPSESGQAYENCALVVLTDHASASASEIVTGTLKYRDRAVVIGARTFGKGSVQYINPLERGALKLTVAQYVGPHMEVIQGTGIEPHIELRAVHARKGIRLPTFADEFEGEGALPYALEKTGAVPVKDSPLYYVRWVPQEEDPDDLDRYDHITVDFPVKLAWALLDHVPRARASQVLEYADELVATMAALQDGLVAELAWTEDKGWECEVNGSEQPIDVTLQMEPERLAAGQEGTLTVTAVNRGPQTACRVYAHSESTHYRFDGETCLLGDLAPGAESRCEMKFTMPATSPQRMDRIYVDLEQDLGPTLATAALSVETAESPLPRFALTWHLDDREGNRDNWPQPGERFELAVEISNIGEGPLEKGLATLKNLSGAALFLQEGRADLADIAPGRRRRSASRARPRRNQRTGSGSSSSGSSTSAAGPTSRPPRSWRCGGPTNRRARSPASWSRWGTACRCAAVRTAPPPSSASCGTMAACRWSRNRGSG